MNDQNSYDHSLRDKLNRLPVPDVQKTWPQMRMLLDEEMPEGGRSRRRGGWWFYTAILIFIIAGSWTLMTFNFSKQNVDPPLSATKNTSPPTTEAGNKKGQEIEFSEKPDVADDKILLKKEINNNDESDQKEITTIPLANNTPPNGADGKQPLSSNAVNAPDGNKPRAAATSVSSTFNNDRDAEVDRSRNANDPTRIVNGVAVAGNENRINGKRGTRDKLNGIKESPNEVHNNSDAEKKLNKASNIRNNKADLIGTSKNSTGRPGLSDNNADQKPSAVVTGAPQEVLEAASIVGIGRPASTSFAEKIDSIEADPSSHITYATVSRKYYRQNKKYGKPVNVKQPYTTEGRNFALGLSLPLAFPLGDQKALGYNRNAGPNTVSDYIPAPHAQYHFNAKAYLQSELQLISPQFIKPALLYQTTTSNNFYQTTSSVSAQKLYYFNVPVSLHYSPFKHFYMGTGLQFSSLLSGVAMHEQLRTGMVSSDSIYRLSYSKFSNDSISNKLSSNEMRLMLDANYYWNKFTVGLRYNQALSNYVSTRAAAGVPLTVDKNKSLQFYMRYNLWEDKRKQKPKALVLR